MAQLARTCECDTQLTVRGRGRSQRAAQRRNHETLRNESGQAQVAVSALGDDPVSANAQRDWAMTYDEQNPELDSQLIILGLGYAISLIVLIGWVATLVV